mmetsp:Transcript_29768/g.60107  ORF Transcript_29768/g.60107 Transcript_29768/m.60107 type:complete len:243 (+) Transcript_29768:422-1150(+)
MAAAAGGRASSSWCAAERVDWRSSIWLAWRAITTCWSRTLVSSGSSSRTRAIILCSTPSSCFTYASVASPPSIGASSIFAAGVGSEPARSRGWGELLRLSLSLGRVSSASSTAGRFWISGYSAPPRSGSASAGRPTTCMASTEPACNGVTGVPLELEMLGLAPRCSATCPALPCGLDMVPRFTRAGAPVAGEMLRGPEAEGAGSVSPAEVAVLAGGGSTLGFTIPLERTRDASVSFLNPSGR